ncbi:NADP-dependent oxidoreductase [Streptomyces fuscichromogenes]|uniref:NADP-dependent oxidoreductase n=1 Tax=Streptomyces fuscichromogenes TaxID=1324013 RepID=UPI003821D953
MRAIGIPRFGTPDVLTVVDRPLPRPGPGEIRVKVTAAAVNPSDLALRAGLFAGFLTDVPPPYTPGMDAAGTVDAAGPGSRFTAGETVMAFVDPLRPGGGAQAEYVVVPDGHATGLPAELDPQAAAALPMNGLTAHQALNLLGLSAGATIAVTGATGALGGYVVQLAVHRGLRVIAGAAPEDHALLRELEAMPVARTADSYLEAVPEGVDALIDAAAVGQPLLSVIRPEGDYVQCRPGPVDLTPGTTLHRLNVAAHPDKAAALAELAALAAKGVLTPRIAGRLTPDRAAQAHRRLEAGGLRGRQLIVF